jgi:Adenylate and Guanylate cyclase catalytic domain
MIARNADIPEDKRISFRIRVNLGDVIVEEDDIYGDGVNVAARLETIAEPGGICISEDAFRQVRGKVDAEFADIGEQSLKHVARPLRVYRVLQQRPTAAQVPVSQPAQLPRLNPGGVEPKRPSFPHRGVPIGRIFRLLLLVSMAVFPMIAIQAWHERDLRNEREGVIRQRVVYRVHQFAVEIGELREGARQLLLAIAQLEAVKLHQPEACSTLLARLRSRYPNYSLLGAADTEGRIFCASGPTATSVAGQPFFTLAIAHDGLAVGTYWVNPANGEKMIHFAEQFGDGNNQLGGVVFAGLDLAWLSDHLKESGLPSTSSKLIADREGNIIARLPYPEEFVGKNVRGSHERIMDGGEAGWEEVTGVDGVPRIFGYVPSALPPKDFFLSIGESKAESFAAINSATWCDAALILAGLLGSICVAWAGRKFVLGPAPEPRQPTADHPHRLNVVSQALRVIPMVGAKYGLEANRERQRSAMLEELARVLNGRRQPDGAALEA